MEAVVFWVVGVPGWRRRSERIEPRTGFLDTSIDPTEARNSDSYDSKQQRQRHQPTLVHGLASASLSSQRREQSPGRLLRGRTRVIRRGDPAGCNRALELLASRISRANPAPYGRRPVHRRCRPIPAYHSPVDGYAARQSNRATPLPGFGNRTNTSGSWPGMISRGLAASFLIRSCAARFDLASSVAVIGTCLSRFSYR